MTKLFTLIIFLSLCTGSLFAQENPATHNFSGVIVFDEGKPEGNKTIVDAKFEQHMLLNKTKQWLYKTQDKKAISAYGKSVVFKTPYYELTLKFLDGKINFTFVDDLNGNELLAKEQNVIDEIKTYVSYSKSEK